MKNNCNKKIAYTAEAYSNAETVGTVDGLTVFVPQMIVGERAEVRLNYVKKGVGYGKAEKIVAPSPKRVQPPCKNFGKCGGCSLMHMNYAEQLVFKRNKVQNNLKKIGGLAVEVQPCVPSPQTEDYRNKLSLPVRGKAGNVQIGMYRQNSHEVVNSDHCLLGGEWSTKLVRIFRKFLNENKIEPYDENTFRGVVRHLVARFMDGQLLVVVVTNGQQKVDWRLLAAELQNNFSQFGLFVNENSLKNNVILGKTTKHVAGQEYIQSQHLGVKFRLRPTSFFQVNNQVKDKLYAKVKELLDVSQTEVLVDCFSGVGVLTTVLASEKYQTFAVEIEPSAVQDAKEIAVLNATPNVTNVCGDVNVELPKIAEQNKGKVMSLVVDPPRKGLGDVCNTVLQAQFNNVVYVSCDSATLARDLKTLSQGYDIVFAQPYDMFPHTDQVETVVLLSRKKAKDYLEVNIEMDDDFLTKAESKGTYD